MTQDMFIEHLAHALAQPGQTIILVTMDEAGLVAQVRSDRPADLVTAARSLLSQASDLLDQEDITPEDDEMLDQVQCALAELPDPDADEDDA